MTVRSTRQGLVWSEKVRDNLIEQQLSYFKGFLGNTAGLVHACTDVVRDKLGRLLTGVKFPLCIIAEALLSCQRLNDVDIDNLRIKLLDYLTRRFEASGFNYFEEPFLPNDLDTTSSLTRSLRTHFPNIINSYDEIIARNTITPGIVSTWLDIENHERWLTGARPYHIDILLNYWLTEFCLQRPVNPTVILTTVKNLGLQNHWYLAPLYSPYLYCELLQCMNLMNQKEFIRPLIDVMDEWGDNQFRYLQGSNNCSIPQIKILLTEQTLPDVISVFMRLKIEACLNRCDLSVKASEASDSCMDQLPQSCYWQSPLYWTLGFTKFSSEPVTRSIILSCLMEI